ncbi:hypothetical protein BGY98DRAFT_1035672 [Russula aff. rugulosa BPL654]|nr:hypothetical protein BGY98DRAFT_1035672 [Russula aff. rugulosa BPL654]
MIYFTTFIFTLLLSHITRAVPACGNAASPKDLYDTTYDDSRGVASTQPDGDTKTLDIYLFPSIGGAFDIKNKISFACNRCWKLHNPKTSRSLYILAVDAAKTGLNISKTAFQF